MIVDPSGDGRQRFADAMGDSIPPSRSTRSRWRPRLYEPADSEPDLVVVLGPPTQLAPSLVWELAYAELVFIPVAWADLAPATSLAAIDAFDDRHRRFGGLD